MARNDTAVLRQVVESPEGLVLVEDRVHAPGRSLWQTCLTESARACVLLSLERPAQSYAPPRRGAFAAVHDMYTEGEGRPPSDAAALGERVTQSLSATTALFIDSIASLVRGVGLSAAYALLDDWQRRAAAIVCVVHTDVLDAYALAALERQARAIIRLGSDDDANADFPLSMRASAPMLRIPCTVVLYKKTGKTVTEKSTLALMLGGGVTFRAEALHEDEVDAAPVIIPAKPPPEVNVSFNMALTPAQREARSRVILPFMRAQEEPAPVPVGNVTYHLDDADDFDEEDPDDDLDI